MNKPSEIYNILQTLDTDTRISRRKKLSKDKIDGLLNTPPEKRSAYSYSQIAESEEIWTLWEPKGLTEFSIKNEAAIFVWPHEEFVINFSKQLSQNLDYKTIPIPMNDFIDEILFYKASEYLLGIFPTVPNEKAIIHSPEEFLMSLKHEISRYNPDNLIL